MRISYIWSEKQSSTCLSQDEISQATKEISYILEKHENEIGNRSKISLAKCYLRLGDFYLANKDIDGVRQCINKITNLGTDWLKLNNYIDHELKSNLHGFRARYYSLIKDHKAAIRELRKSLRHNLGFLREAEITEQICFDPKERPSTIGIKSELADSFRQNENDNNLQKYQDQIWIFNMRRLVLNKILHNKLALADAYRTSGNYEEAYLIYNDVVKETQDLLGEEHPQMASCLSSLGVAELDRGNKVKAMELFKAALQVRINNDGLEDEENTDIIDPVLVRIAEGISEIIEDKEVSTNMQVASMLSEIEPYASQIIDKTQQCEN